MTFIMRLLTIVITIFVLTGCQLFPSSVAQNATQTAGSKAVTPIGVSQGATTPVATIAPGATAVPGSAPVPAAVPTSVARSLVGPEWTLLYAGDLNADSRADVVAIKLAQGVTADATFRQPGYSAYKGPASEMVIVQAGDDGKPQVLLTLAGGRVQAGSNTVASVDGAAAYMVNVTPGAQPLITIWGISAAGKPVGSAVGIEWNNGYGLFGGLRK